MSRAAIICALREVLHRQPTSEEYEAFRGEAHKACNGERMYIPVAEPQGELFNTARTWKANGKSIRHIAKLMKISKSRVHRLLSQDSPYSVDSKP